MAATKIPIELSSTPGIVDNSNATAITIDSNENVGIGGASTLATLETRGNEYSARFFGTTTAYGLQIYHDEVSTIAKLRHTNSGGDLMLEAGTTSGLLFFNTAGSERMRIDSSGNVGIGTTSFSQLLNIQSSSFPVAEISCFSDSNPADASALDLIEKQPSFASSSSTFGQTGVYGFRFKLNGSDNTLRIQSGSQTTVADRITLDRDTGNVGIGTSSPDAQGGNQNTILNLEGSDNLVYFSGGSGGNAVDDGLAIEGVATGVTSGDKRTGSILMTRANTSTTSLDSKITFYTTSSGTHAIRTIIDPSGNVGIGTTSPSAKFTNYKNTSISGTGGATLSLELNTEPRLLLTSDSSASYISSFDSNPIIFSVTAGNFASSTGTERMRIDSSGNLLVGTTSSSAYATGVSALATTTAALINVGHINGTASGNAYATFGYNNVGIGSITQNGTTAVAYNTSSDARLKDVTGSARGLEVINTLNPVAFNWKADGKADEGLLAQEVLEIVPNAVTGSEEEYYQMDYSKLVTHLVAGMKEQQTLIEELKTRIETLENS